MVTVPYYVLYGIISGIFYFNESRNGTMATDLHHHVSSLFPNKNSYESNK